MQTVQFKPEEHTFFSAANGIFFKIILRDKENLNKDRTSEIISCILSGQSGINMDINNNKGHRKHTNLWKLNNILMNDNCIMKEIKKEKLKFLELIENEDISCQYLLR